jgi:hypothetical protein
MSAFFLPFLDSFVIFRISANIASLALYLKVDIRQKQRKSFQIYFDVKETILVGCCKKLEKFWLFELSRKIPATLVFRYKIVSESVH